MMDTLNLQCYPCRLQWVRSDIDWLITTLLSLKLVRSNKQFYLLPNSVQTFFASLLDSSFVEDLVISTTIYQKVRANIRSEFHRVELKEVDYTLTIFFPMRLMCFSNLPVLSQLSCKYIANIAIYYTILTILKVYISSFTQF